MQSAVIVLLKLLLATVTANSNANNNGGGQGNDSGNGEPIVAFISTAISLELTSARLAEEPVELSLEDTDINRHREITSKAVSAILILTLKWFKTSRELLVWSCCPRLLTCLFNRRDEIPLPFAATSGLELPAAHPQDVRLTRSLDFGQDQERATEYKVRRMHFPQVLRSLN